MEKWTGVIALVVFGLLFGWVAVAFLRKSRKRRRELYAEDTRGLAEAEDREALPFPEAGELEAGEPAPGAKPEPELEEPAVVEEPEHEPEEPEAAEEPEAEAEAEAEDQRALEGPPVEVDAALRVGLAKTSDSFFSRLGKLFGGAKIDPALLDDLEEALLVADVGVKLTSRMIGELRQRVTSGKVTDGAALRSALKEKLTEAIRQAPRNGDPLQAQGVKPRVIMFVGVNGVGKTTTIGKVASKLKELDQDVLLAAGDTFRAAAVEQLGIWGERTGCKVHKGAEGSDPASVIFNAIQSAAQKGADVVLADTAGRLHTKTELMDEIRKVKRAAGKALEGAPHEVWLVVDATTGQNAVRQADEFNRALGVTGVILTKLDGTAKGGVVVAIAEALSIPVLFVGVGEKASDLRPFDATGFVDALFAG